MNLAKLFFYYYNNVFHVVSELSVAVWPWPMILTGGLLFIGTQPGNVCFCHGKLQFPNGMILMAQ